MDAGFDICSGKRIQIFLRMRLWVSTVILGTSMVRTKLLAGYASLRIKSVGGEVSKFGVCGWGS